MKMRTGVKATNWPKRADAAHNMPRKSRKGENVASPQTRKSRRKKAAERAISDLLEYATRKFSRITHEQANTARANAQDTAGNQIVDALQRAATRRLIKAASL